jgi:hypothetical protein
MALGWHMAEFLDETPPKPGASPPDGALVGLSRLGGDDQRALRLDQVQTGLHRLRPVLVDAGLDPAAITIDDLTRNPGSQEAELHKLHNKILVALTAADPRIGKAYGLGRGLADLYLRPAPADGDDVLPHLRSDRLSTLAEWLGDLASALPDHAARSVLGSLDNWQAWCDHPKVDGRAAVASDHDRAVRALRAQGKLWRSILTGEKLAVDMLNAREYVGAGVQLLAHYRTLGRGVLMKYWPVLVTALVAAVAVVAIARVSSSGTATFVTSVAAVATALGITGKSLTAAGTRVVNEVKDSLWNAELDTAIGEAVTITPDKLSAKQRPKLVDVASRMATA